MSLAKVFDKLGQTVIPNIASKVFPDTMRIVRDVTTSDGGGGQVKSDTTDTNDEAIPCSYLPMQRFGYKTERGDRMVSVAQYIVTFPTHNLGERIDLLPSDRLLVLERGNEPEKLFRQVAVKDFGGVNYQVTCERENNQ